jgi:hypothetical protein
MADPIRHLFQPDTFRKIKGGSKPPFLRQDITGSFPLQGQDDNVNENFTGWG